MIIVPDFIWMPLVTWGLTAMWFKRHELFGVDEEEDKSGAGRTSKQRNS